MNNNEHLFPTELAKRMKDAGFPQEVKGGSVRTTETGEVVYLPTFDEIEEQLMGREIPISSKGFEGATPRITAAQLWIGLNK